MTAVTFDTYAAIKVMKDSGLEEAHAEAIVAVIRMSGAHRDNLVTEAVLRAAVEDLEQRLTMRLGLMMSAVAELSLGIAKLLF